MTAGALFEPVLVSRELPQDPRISELTAWAARFSALGWTPSYGPGDHGNLSVRTEHGLITTARETEKSSLRPEHFVEVLGIDRQGAQTILRCRGVRLPSTDALMHMLLYRLLPNIGAILHGHDPLTLAHAMALRLPVTSPSAKVQSMEVVDDACRLAPSSEYLLLRDHGFLSLGKSVERAGALALSWSERARALSESRSA